MKSLFRALGILILSLPFADSVAAQLPPDRALAPTSSESTAQPADARPVSKGPCIPTATDRLAAKPPAQLQVRQKCPYSVELAVAADDAWEVFVNGARLSPNNGSNESDWATPASYMATVSGGSELIIAIHARDVSRVQSGLIAWARVKRLSPPTVLQDWIVPTGSGNGWYAFQQPLLATKPIPPNWNTAPYLPFDPSTAADWAPATLASNACTNVWGGNSTFLSHWASASGGASPSDWVWEYSCQANTKPWRRENWYRLELPLDYCPVEAPPPKKGCTWKLASHGAADGFFDTPPVQGCSVNASATPPTASCIDRVGCHWIPSLCKYICGFDFWSWECVHKKTIHADAASPSPQKDRDE